LRPARGFGHNALASEVAPSECLWPVNVRDAGSAYRKLLTALVSRAVRMRSRDAEGAAQEALKRSLANPRSRAAVEYYFHDFPAADVAVPEWPLDQLLAWLHGVLRFVVREEGARLSRRREVYAFDDLALRVADPAPAPLEVLITDQLHGIARECLSALGNNYRRVLTLRASGLKYAEIATRMGVSENTVATWIRRATREVAQQVSERTNSPSYEAGSLDIRNDGGSHA
jgi:RNA polymerase sigma factor (sigma-70 family)